MFVKETINKPHGRGLYVDLPKFEARVVPVLNSGVVATALHGLELFYELDVGQISNGNIGRTPAWA